MRTLNLAAAVAGSLLLLAPGAPAQQQQDQGWRGTLDQLNRTINPDVRPRDDPMNDRERIDSRDRRDDRDRRYEGASGSSAELRRYSDDDIRDRLGRLSDEQRQLQRERRALEDEMSRRGLRR